MEEKFAKIEMNRFNDNICLKLNLNNKLKWHEIKIDSDKIKTENLLFWWMLKALKPLFFEMPLKKIDFTYSKDAYERFGNTLNNCSAIITRTNNEINNYVHRKTLAKNHKNILFFNVDDNYRFIGLYERLCLANTKNLSYLNMYSGFNQKTRTWEKIDVPMPLTELINLIVKKEIKKIVSINHYVLERYLLKVGVYLLPLFKYLGVEYVIMESDICDERPHGYIMKSFFNCNSFNRFTAYPTFQEYWDNKYELENIHYVSVPQSYESEIEKQKLNKDYALLVLSNSRLGNVKPWINSITYLLDHMPKDSIFTEVQLWYLSLRHMILKIIKLGELEQLHFNSLLHQFFYNVMQFLKYEIIDSIDTTRKIEIYGDIGWQKIYPEYYEKLLNIKEMDDLFLKNSHLYLLLNEGFSYLEASGPLYDAIKKNVPFINISPLAKTPSFEGFQHIEYRNKEELNYLIENARTVVVNEELKNSMCILKKILKDSENKMVEKILCDRTAADDGVDIFNMRYKEHQALLDQMAEEYIDENEAFLRETFRVLLLGKPFQYDASKSKYFNRKYVQRILQSIQKEQSIPV